MHPAMPKRRRLFLLLVAYLFATGGGAWLAFSFGVNRSLAALAPTAAPGHTLAQGWVDNTEVVWSCEGFLGFTGLPAVHLQRKCGPGGNAKTAANSLTGKGPLTAATVRKIAGGRPRTSASLMEVPRPTGVAGFDGPAGRGEDGPLGPVFSPAPNLPGFTSFGGPGGNPGPGLPGVLLGGDGFDLPPSGPEGPEGPETPIDPLVTPLPGAAPLLLTGLAGLAGLRRRRTRVHGYKVQG